MRKIEVIVNFQQSLFKKKLIILYILNIKKLNIFLTGSYNSDYRCYFAIRS